MKSFLSSGLASVFILSSSLLIVNCGKNDDTNPNGPVIILNVNNTNTNNNGNGNPSDGTLPTGSLPSGVPTSVRVTQFSQGAGDRTINVGGTISLTCTPRKSDGTDYWAGVPESSIKSPDFFGVLAGSSFIDITSRGANGYNMEVKGIKAGDAVFNCNVLGVEGSPVFTLKVQ